MSPPDSVSLYALSLVLDIGADHWDRQRPQPVQLTLHLHTSLALAGSSDSVTDSIHYGHVAQAMLDLQTRPFSSLIHFAEAAADAAMQFAPDGVHVLAEAPKLLLQARSLSVEVVRSRALPSQLSVHINQLSLHTIIGVNSPERLHKQQVITSISFLAPHPAGYPFPHRVIVDRLAEHIESSNFLTLETLATSVARVSCFLDGMDLVTIKAQKPSALSFGHSSGVQVSRNRAFFFQRDAHESTPVP